MIYVVWMFGWCYFLFDEFLDIVFGLELEYDFLNLYLCVFFCFCLLNM